MPRCDRCADGESAKPVRRRLVEALTVGAGALLALWLLLLLQGPQPALRGDQIAINLMVVKSLHPDWFQGDLLYGPNYYRSYTPLFVGLQATLARFLGDDPIAALRALYWPVGVLFIVGHYVLFRSLTGVPLVAGMGALSAMTVRNALGGEYWGFGGVGSVQPRVVAEGLTPLLVVAFLRWRTHRLFPAFFLLVGGVANLHPVSGFHLAQITALTHLWLARFRWRAWAEATIGAGLFTIGALPFIVRFYTAKENLADPVLLRTVRAALDYRFDYLLLPQRLDALLSVAVHAILPIVLLLWLRRQRAWHEQLQPVMLLGALALLAGFAGTAAIQGFGVVAERPYVDIMQLRSTKFMYLPLLVAFPLAFLELLSRRRANALLALTLLFAASLIPPGFVIHSVSEERRDRVKQILGVAVKPRPSREVDPGESVKAEAALRQWVIEHTHRNDLFFTDSSDFRANTLRPITGTLKDGAYVVLAGTAPLYRWFIYIREVEGCRAQRGANCWFELASKYQAKYVVVDPGVKQAVPGDGFIRVWSRSGWSLWRRSEVR